MLYAIIAVIVLILDQWLKYWTTVNITLSTGEVPLIDGVIKLVNVHNDGAAFGILGDVPYMKWVFIGLTLVLTVAVIVLLVKKVFRGKFASLCLVLILAGAMGNCIDRLIHGYVVDMFKLEFVNFAVFNIADAVLVVAGLLFIIYLFVGDRSGGADEDDEDYDDEDDEDERPVRKPSRRSKVEIDEASDDADTEKQDPFWDSFKASLREDEKAAEEKKQKAKEFDLSAVKEAAKPAREEAPEFKIPPKEEPAGYSLEDILAEFK